jgi:hypothetical protein
VPVLFGSDEGMRSAIVAHQHEGQPCEFFWRASALPPAV